MEIFYEIFYVGLGFFAGVIFSSKITVVYYDENELEDILNGHDEALRR